MSKSWIDFVVDATSEDEMNSLNKQGDDKNEQRSRKDCI